MPDVRVSTEQKYQTENEVVHIMGGLNSAAGMTAVAVVFTVSTYNPNNPANNTIKQTGITSDHVSRAGRLGKGGCICGDAED